MISVKGIVEKISIDGEDIHILDLSSGTGNIAIELGKKFPQANIYGVEIY
ncbi:MAG: polypeptide subunit release factor methylase [Sulfurimonas sp.]|jgi:methylase of polypeptide subunit release factors